MLRYGPEGSSTGPGPSNQVVDKRKKLKTRKSTTIQKILEQCQNGFHGVGFNEVVLMLYNSVAIAEVYMNMDDMRFTHDGKIVTFMAEHGTAFRS